MRLNFRSLAPMASGGLERFVLVRSSQNSAWTDCCLPMPPVLTVFEARCPSSLQSYCLRVEQNTNPLALLARKSERYPHLQT